MIHDIDDTHDPLRRSWVHSANDPWTDFPIQNLPLAVFSPPLTDAPRIGIAIGDQVIDVRAALMGGCLKALNQGEALCAASLDSLFAAGQDVLGELRRQVGRLLDASASNEQRHAVAACSNAIADCTFYRPTSVPNYTDFYAGIYHARAAGALLTPQNALPRNYLWVPIAYHGRASTVVVSGADILRPLGQRSPAEPDGEPGFGPSVRLDLELELGCYIGRGNARGTPIAIGQADEHIAGYSLLNDWSARDLQSWEMFPLGPFLSKSFATTVSPWVVSAAALAPFRVPAMSRDAGAPASLAYLLSKQDQQRGGLNIHLEALMTTARMRAAGETAVRISHSNARHLYWTPAQMVAHHTINGCALQPGDLIGSGTISGPVEEELASLLERTAGGTKPILLPNGEQRAFLLDEDEITLTGRCEREGFVSIGFGPCTGRVLANPDLSQAGRTCDV